MHALKGRKHTVEHNAKISDSRMKSKRVFRYPREIRICAAPGCCNTFETPVGATNERFYCCRGHNRIGVTSPLKGGTKETDPGVAKMSQSKTGRVQSAEEKKRRSAALVGRSYVELFGEEKAAQLRQLRREENLGEKSPSWRGGIHADPYPEEFQSIRQEVLFRDENQCCLCGIAQSDIQEELAIGLHVHHVDYNKNCNQLDNLVSLCARCHGRTNYQRDFWESYWKGYLRYLPFTWSHLSGDSKG